MGKGWARLVALDILFSDVIPLFGWLEGPMEYLHPIFVVAGRSHCEVKALD